MSESLAQSSTQVQVGLCHCCLLSLISFVVFEKQISRCRWLSWPFSMCWVGLQQAWGVIFSKCEVMVLNVKKTKLPLGLRWVSASSWGVQESGILLLRDVTCGGAASATMRTLLQSVAVRKEMTLNLLVLLSSCSHLWSWGMNKNLGTRSLQWDQAQA